jgi:DNA-damage-inducible protein D
MLSMNKKLTKSTKSIFEQIMRLDDAGNEFWSARDLSKILDYADYRNFKTVITKATESCKNSGFNVQNHIVGFTEMVLIGSGAERQVDDTKLSRYTCYLILQNADPSKAVVAQGQTYFAVQTRLQEIKQMDDYNILSSEDEKRLFLSNELRRHNSQLAEAAQNAGVISNMDYAVFQNHGYKGLYGGLDAKAIHSQKGLKNNQHILDHMGSTELAANLFRATQT